MPRTPRYKKRLTDEEVLDLFTSGVYSVNLTTGEVTNRCGKTLTPFYAGKKGFEYPFIRLYGNGERTISVAKVIWMVGTNSVLPASYEIHHEDLDRDNYRFSNLYCLHPADHKKKHTAGAEVPF